MMKNENLKNKGKEMLVRAAYKCTEIEVNSICPWFLYQPEIPVEARKLKKHV